MVISSNRRHTGHYTTSRARSDDSSVAVDPIGSPVFLLVSTETVTA